MINDQWLIQNKAVQKGSLFLFITPCLVLYSFLGLLFTLKEYALQQVESLFSYVISKT